MARTTKRGKCELCGEVANVGTNHGSATCPKCTHVQAALANRLQAVAKAARAMGKAEDLIKALIPDGGSLAVQVTADLLQEISGIVGYDGEDPAELVEAVRKSTALAAHQLISEAETGALRTIAGIVGYEGTDGEQLVEAVRKRVLTCASCEAEDVLAEIREIVEYTPERGDKGLADAVRAMVASGGAECNNEELRLRDDLARACDMDQDYSYSWSTVVQVAIQEIARLEYRRDFWASKATRFKIEAGDLESELLAKRGEIEELRSKFQEALDANDSLVGECSRRKDTVGVCKQHLKKLRVELILAQQARDEWEQRCAAAEESMQDMEAELCNREDAPAAPCASTTYLLDIALKALRGEGPDADQLAVLIDAARRAA